MYQKFYNHIRIFLFFTVLCVLVNENSVHAESKEYLVKAAFLYNFAKFIEWPPQAFKDDLTPFNLCICGKDMLDVALKSLKDKTVHGRKVVIRKFSGIKDAKTCHILFISRSEQKNIEQILLKSKDFNILTIGETKNFVQHGGIINFFMEKNKIRFEINVDAAKQKGIQISSKLLRLAKIIREKK